MKINYKAIIKKLMKENQIYRDSDRLLVLAVWREFGFYLTEEQHDLFMKIPQAQIIVRRRQELRDLYPSSKEVDDKRFEHYKEFKEEVTVPKAVSWLNDED